MLFKKILNSPQNGYVFTDICFIPKSLTGSLSIIKMLREHVAYKNSFAYI